MKTSKAKKYQIDVLKKIDSPRICGKKARRVVSIVCEELKVKYAYVSLCFVSNREIKRLNKQFKRRNDFTDVLAFPMAGGSCENRQRRTSLVGEIIISLDQAKINAKQFGNSYEKEVLLYIIHGILHIKGYDDISRRKRLIMERKQNALLQKVMKHLSKK